MSEPILIAGTVDVAPEQREAALKAGQPHMAATRAQDGCIDYNWAADHLTPGRIYVFERWRDQAALEAHFKGPHYLAMRNTIAQYGLRAADTAKYRVDLSEPVYDETMTPRADFFTG